MNIITIPILKDNYSYLINDGNGHISIIDPGEAEPIIKYLEHNSLHLNTIINTHHHGDHVAGNAALKAKYRAHIFAPKSEASKISAVDVTLKNNDSIDCGTITFKCIETPGHTLGHICLYSAEHKIFFAGDTLFSLGCGRLFEGSHEQMYNSLQLINALPDDTLLYCGHEYTMSNAQFCLKHAPNNLALQRRYSAVKLLRAQGKPTLPVLLETEKNTNVFLMAKNADEFKHLRLLKDKS